MPLIVDTYNVLHVVGVLPPEIAGVDIEGLARLIAHSRYRRTPTTLVCDGKAGPGPAPDHPETVTVRYAGHPATADDVIAALVRESSAPRRLVVVSSDRAVLSVARRRRCETLTSEAFLRQLAADHRAPRTPSDEPPAPGGRLPREEVDAWVDRFAVTAADLVLDEPEPPVTPPEPPALREPEPTPDPAEEDAPARPAPGPPLFPADLLREAMAMAAAEPDLAPPAREEKREEEERRGDEANPAEEERPVSPYAAFLPEEMIAEAEALSGGPAEPEGAAEAEAETPGEPGERETPRRVTGGVLSSDVIAEAEALWREGVDDEADPGEPGDEPRGAG